MKVDVIGKKNERHNFTNFETILIKIKKLPFLGNKIFNYAVKVQGGQTRSTLLRKYYETKNVKVGQALNGNIR